MEKTYMRGDIYYADLPDSIGSEQKGPRPVVIIQNNMGNKYSPTVIVAAITSKADVKPRLPTHYYIEKLDGLEWPSIILMEQIRTIDKRRLDGYIGHLSKEHITGMNHALAVSINLIEDVPNPLIMCLCQTCADNFRSEGNNFLRRIDPYQTECNTCTCCNCRKGYDYELIPKKQSRQEMQSTREVLNTHLYLPAREDERAEKDAAERHEPMFPNYPDVVNVEQLCEMLGGISVKAGYRLLKSGAIKSFVIARRYRIPKLNVIDYLEGKEKPDA